jgi:CDP-diacylglycerol--glycerol-3-phosphate 3-phosphatidyltransferase
VAFTIAALALGQIVSYTRARAEGLGAQAAMGLAERAERLIVVLVAAGIVGLGAPVQVLVVAMAVLAVASAVTVGQRFAAVRRQLYPGSRTTGPEEER